MDGRCGGGVMLCGDSGMMDGRTVVWCGVMV